MSQPTLGQPPIDNNRDAIHIAILPVYCNDPLTPGQRVEYKGSNRVEATTNKGHGIIDPFLEEPIPSQKLVYMLLHPNSVTGMRHAWECPDIDTSNSEIVTRVAESWGISEEKLLDFAKDYISNGNAYVGSEDNYYNVSSSEWIEFWTYMKLTYNPTTEVIDYAPFRCAC